MGDKDSSVHLIAIRKALASGNAAVMVGAGFSRNAEGGDQLKTWPELGRELWAALNPDAPMNGLSSTLVTQLGEQYARVFSPPALEDLLKRLIPDNRVVPGALHDQLLRLPWCEIFTTNYDTLLERAAEKIFDRAHLTVCCREDIPQSKVLGRRRIVKLHGSFPSQRPFIFTEEDYRTYPENFAPFVNLVRQSLLENVFCLIGFSGEDPNFLHWIGWVRDMLDKHTLPIYLFVNKLPSLGEQKLLEARRVIPVVLPIADGSDQDDFRARYEELFRLLSAPLENSDLKWGDISIPSHLSNYEEDEDKRFQHVLEVFPLLVAERNRYPGWMVAPEEIRQTFEYSLGRLGFTFQDRWLIQRLDSNPAVASVLLSQYVWQQEILLQPLEDECARFGVRILQLTQNLQLSELDAETGAALQRLSIPNQKMLDANWRNLALGLLRWARQALDERTFHKIALLISSAKKTPSATVVDEVQYESVLLHLYRGERNCARKLLAEWKLRTADPYMIVRKSSLLAEVGDTEEAFNACLDAIQNLRRSQKIAPDSALLLSQEAWACLIASNIQRARTVFSFTADPVDENEANSLESLGRRLKDLAARDIDVRAELKALIAKLDAEAQPPTALKYRFGGLDLGRSSSFKRLGWPSELVSKIQAAFAWLTVTERVGLVPRLGNVIFYQDQYTQAAWWVQYADSVQRMLSVVVRTFNKDVLKPKDDSVPHHKTGWLSRFQVARMELSLATDMAERSLAQVEAALTSSLPANEVERVCEFHIEVFSRLVIRISDSGKVFEFGKRIVALHVDGRLSLLDGLWGAFARTLARCFEALPTESQLKLLPLVADVPTIPRSSALEHYISSWVQPFELTRWLRTSSIEPHQNAWCEQIVNELLRQLRSRNCESLSDVSAQLIWQRLGWLNHLGLIEEPARRVIGELLWSKGAKWPIIPGFYPQGTLAWPAPIDVSVEERFREWILAQSLVPFGSPSSMIVHIPGSKRAWGLPGDDGFLTTWLASLRVSPWPDEAMRRGLQTIRGWWEAEGSELEQALPRLDDLREALLRRLDLIDEILAAFLLQAHRQEGMDDDIWEWVRGWISSLNKMGAPFWRYRLRSRSIAEDNDSIRVIEEEIAASFLSAEDARQLYQAHDVACSWIESSTGDQHYRPELLLSSLLSVVSARKMPALSPALDLLARTVRYQPKWLDDLPVAMLKFGLKALLEELDYKRRSSGSGIPDDEVPLLRFRCAKLAFELEHANFADVGTIAQAWVSSAHDDPLPEMRFQRYCIVPT